jgi:hypothetical protein
MAGASFIVARFSNQTGEKATRQYGFNEQKPLFELTSLSVF